MFDPHGQYLLKYNHDILQFSKCFGKKRRILLEHEHTKMRSLATLLRSSKNRKLEKKTFYLQIQMDWTDSSIPHSLSATVSGRSILNANANFCINATAAFILIC